MPTQVIEYKCLLISPSDVTAERDALTDLTNYWNAHIGKGLGARLNLVRWESHAVPEMGKHPQEVINSQLVRECDLGIAVFWSKVGTPTPNHPSGSAEEIFELLQKGNRVLVYFCTRPIPQAALEGDQYAKLQELKRTIRDQGLDAEYFDVPNLREQVQLHLTNVITQLLAKDRGTTTFVPSSGTLTAPTPDVRVVANPHFVTDSSPYKKGVETVLGVEVQNHSPVTVFLSGISFEMKNGMTMTPTRDSVTGEQVRQRQLQSGQSYTLYLGAEQLREHANELICARATDAVGRVYRSKAEYFPMVVKSVLKSHDQG